MHEKSMFRQLDLNGLSYDFIGFIGEDGEFTKKTKYTHPYNYDSFVVWQGEGKATNSVYTDRLFQWDWDKHNTLCMKHFGNKGQYWGNRDPEKIESFLRDYMDKPKLKLVKNVEYCNVATGYPCWRLDYIT